MHSSLYIHDTIYIYFKKGRGNTHTLPEREGERERVRNASQFIKLTAIARNKKPTKGKGVGLRDGFGHGTARVSCIGPLGRVGEGSVWGKL